VDTTFGEFVKTRRLGRRITLRAFCEAVNVDPANYSKIERGISQPPRDMATLDRYKRALNIGTDTEEGRELDRLAALGRGELPRRVLADQELMSKLPAFFRTLEGDPVDDALLDELVETIRRE
jgi:transcriptional regulator with XRE-family HTH domain